MPAQIGILVGVELAVSFAARALAGRAADHRERVHVAASGAGLYAISCAAYATAPNLGVALGAAVGLLHEQATPDLRGGSAGWFGAGVGR